MDNRKLAKRLNGIAHGEYYDASILRNAYKRDDINIDEKRCIKRWLIGTDTVQDFFGLQSIANNIYSAPQIMNNLKAWRKQHGLTQSACARMVYCSDRQWIRVEHGTAPFKQAWRALLTLRTDNSAKFRQLVERKLKDI